MSKSRTATAYAYGAASYGLSTVTVAVDSSVSNIPILIGGRYFFDSSGAGLFAGAEFGLNLLKQEVKATTGSLSSTSDTTARFGANLGFGYVVSRSLPIDLGAQVALLNLAGGDDGNTLVAVNLLAGYSASF